MSQPSSSAAPDRSRERRLMVDGQIRTFGVTDLDVIDRFLAVPRENFVEPEQRGLAYSDAPLKLAGPPPRHLLAPMFLARMIQAAELRADDRILDLAGGLGYGAALMSPLVKHVLALESGSDRVALARKNLMEAGCGNVEPREGPVAGGWREGGPYDVILLQGGYSAGLEPLLAQLADGGRLIAVQMAPAGGFGQVVRFQSHGGISGNRPMFDARAAAVEGLEAAPAFAF